MSKRKIDDSDSGNPNKDISDFLMELSDYEKNVSRNTFKANAYRKAAKTLASLPERVKSGEEARKLEGIGDRISKKIDEYLSTGKLKKLETIRHDESAQSITELTRVVGIGPAKARELVESGIKTIDDLRQNQESLSKAQKIGLKYFEDLEQRIPRKEIRQIEKFLKREIQKLDSKYDVTICGSYRRGLSTSGDIDVLITHEDHPSTACSPRKGGKAVVDEQHLLHKVVEALEKCDLVTDTLSLGDNKFMGICKLPDEPDSNEKHLYRRLDIRLLPKDQYYCGVLYFTGSDVFNKSMRTHALEKGFTLNEYTIRPVDDLEHPLPVTCEEDIFDYISYEFKKPQDRNF